VARGSYPEVVSGVAKNDGAGVHATSSTDSARVEVALHLHFYRMLVVVCSVH
jgi:hypothetical protein